MTRSIVSKRRRRRLQGEFRQAAHRQSFAVEGHKLVAQAARRPGDRPKTYADILARCNPDGLIDPFEAEWMDMPAVGREIDL